MMDFVQKPTLSLFDRLLRSIEQNQGKLSNVLAKEMPVLRTPGVWEDIVAAVKNTLAC